MHGMLVPSSLYDQKDRSKRESASSEKYMVARCVVPYFRSCGSTERIFEQINNSRLQHCSLQTRVMSSSMTDRILCVMRASHKPSALMGPCMNIMIRTIPHTHRSEGYRGTTSEHADSERSRGDLTIKPRVLGNQSSNRVLSR